MSPIWCQLLKLETPVPPQRYKKFANKAAGEPYPHSSMQELRKRATMLIRVEDMRQYQSNAQSPPTRAEIKRTNKEPTPRDHNRPSERRPAKFSNYAPLNAPRSRILDEVIQAELIPPPRKYQNPPNADLSKYCHYHRNNGHTTDECDTRRDKIEELVRAGHLRHYIREIGEGPSRPRYDRNDNRRTERGNDRRVERREPRRAQPEHITQNKGNQHSRNHDEQTTGHLYAEQSTQYPWDL